MLCSGVVETLGRVDYGGKLKHSLTAHPKLDPVTGTFPHKEQGSGFTLPRVQASALI